MTILNATIWCWVAKNLVFSMTRHATWSRPAKARRVYAASAFTVYTPKSGDGERTVATPVEHVRAVSRLTSFVHGRWWRWGRSRHRWAANLIENSWGLLSGREGDGRGTVRGWKPPEVSARPSSLHGGPSTVLTTICPTYMHTRVRSWCMFTRICCGVLRQAISSHASPCGRNTRSRYEIPWSVVSPVECRSLLSRASSGNHFEITTNLYTS